MLDLRLRLRLRRRRLWKLRRLWRRRGGRGEYLLRQRALVESPRHGGGRGGHRGVPGVRRGGEIQLPHELLRRQIPLLRRRRRRGRRRGLNPLLHPHHSDPRRFPTQPNEEEEGSPIESLETEPRERDPRRQGLGLGFQIPLLGYGNAL